MKLKTAAILAGGKSSRFGDDKALAPFGEISLIEYVFKSLKPLFKDIFIVSGKNLEYNLPGAEVLPDIIESSGPLGGIHAALSAVDKDYVFIAACDMPYISGNLISRMQTVLLKDMPPAVVTGRNGFIEPFHAYYSTKLVPKIESALKDSSCGIFSFLKQISPIVVNAGNEQTFININTPDDLERYSRIIQSRR